MTHSTPSKLSQKFQAISARLHDFFRELLLPHETVNLADFDQHALRDIGLDKSDIDQVADSAVGHFVRLVGDTRAMSIGLTGL